MKISTHTDKPGPPTDFVVSSTTANSVSFKWLEPNEDGGCLIKQYVVERRDTSRNQWVKEGVTQDLELTSASTLTPEQPYYFRVAAENDVGLGPFVELSKPVVPKSQFGWYKIVMINLVNSEYLIIIIIFLTFD